MEKFDITPHKSMLVKVQNTLKSNKVFCNKFTFDSIGQKYITDFFDSITIATLDLTDGTILEQYAKDNEIYMTSLIRRQSKVTSDDCFVISNPQIKDIKPLLLMAIEIIDLKEYNNLHAFASEIINNNFGVVFQFDKYYTVNVDNIDWIFKVVSLRPAYGGFLDNDSKLDILKWEKDQLPLKVGSFNK